VKNAFSSGHWSLLRNLAISWEKHDRRRKKLRHYITQGLSPPFFFQTRMRDA
jgi:hypothetical protein